MLVPDDTPIEKREWIADELEQRVLLIGTEPTRNLEMATYTADAVALLGHLWSIGALAR